MPVTLTEMVDSREMEEGRGPDGETRLTQLTLHYKFEGVSDDDTARTLVENSTPTAYGDLERSGITIEPEWVDTTTGAGCWDVEVEYTLPEEEEPQTGESSYSFDTGGGTQHITQSIATVGKYGGIFDPPDFKGAVGVTHDNVEGVDITTPVFNWSETHYLPDSVVTPAYRGALFRLTGTVNQAPFKGCAVGECLFLGASGSKRGQEDWEITFRFAASPNKTGIVINGITVESKKGWEYLWVRYADEEDTDAHELVKRPIAAYVDQVYEYGDFSDLEIGT